MKIIGHFKGEDGVDEGGLTKEFCSLVVSKFLNDTTLFGLGTDTNRWWFSPPRYKYMSMNKDNGNIDTGVGSINMQMTEKKLVKEEVPVNLFELFLHH